MHALGHLHKQQLFEEGCDFIAVLHLGLSLLCNGGHSAGHLVGAGAAVHCGQRHERRAAHGHVPGLRGGGCHGDGQASWHMLNVSIMIVIPEH